MLTNEAVHPINVQDFNFNAYFSKIFHDLQLFKLSTLFDEGENEQMPTNVILFNCTNMDGVFVRFRAS